MNEAAMTEKECLLDIMKNHRGRDRAVSNQELASRMGMAATEVRELYSELVSSGAGYLGSHPEKGFFMIEDEEDFQLSVRNIKGRISKLAARLQALENMHEQRQTVSFDEARARLRKLRGLPENSIQ